jgi:hypothetical protein
LYNAMAIIPTLAGAENVSNSRGMLPSPSRLARSIVAHRRCIYRSPQQIARGRLGRKPCIIPQSHREGHGLTRLPNRPPAANDKMP